MNTAPSNESTNDEYQALLAAIKAGSIDKIKALLADSKGNLELATAKRNEPIRLAAECGQAGVIKYLLDTFESIDPNQLDKNGKNAVNVALEAKCLMGFQYIVQSKQFNPYYYNPFNKQPIPKQEALNAIAKLLIQKVQNFDDSYYPFADAFFNGAGQCMAMMAVADVYQTVNKDNIRFIIFHEGFCVNNDGLNDLITNKQLTLEALKQIYNKANDVSNKVHAQNMLWGEALNHMKHVIDNPPTVAPPAKPFTPSYDSKLYQGDTESLQEAMEEVSLEDEPENQKPGDQSWCRPF